MIEIQDLLYQLRVSEQASTQLFEKRLGISLTRYQMLLFLLEHSPCNQMAVQERLKIDQAALTRHFKILEKEGLVERHRNPENQREMLVEATKYAKEQLVMNPPLQHIKVKESMESILTDSERTELSRLLNKLVLGIENIEIQGEIDVNYYNHFSNDCCFGAFLHFLFGKYCNAIRCNQSSL